MPVDVPDLLPLPPARHGTGVHIDAGYKCVRQHPTLQDHVLLPLLADTELVTSNECVDKRVRCCMILYDRTPLFAVLHPQIVALKHSIHKCEDR